MWSRTLHSIIFACFDMDRLLLKYCGILIHLSFFILLLINIVCRYEQLAGAGAPDRVEQYRRTLRQVVMMMMMMIMMMVLMMVLILKIILVDFKVVMIMIMISMMIFMMITIKMMSLMIMLMVIMKRKL